MGSYNQGGRSDGGRGGNRGRRSFSGGRDFGRSKTPNFSAICDDCGKSCELPFKPSGNKPVYCSRCFEKHGNGEDNYRRNDDRNNRGGKGDYNNRSNNYEEKQMFSAKCDECGKRCEVPFRPSGDKPVYCSDCFENKGNGRQNNSGNNNAELKTLLDEMNKKLDTILKSLNKGA